jgi:predicted HAD superfamily Cof-like phosphohydrolase
MVLEFHRAFDCAVDDRSDDTAQSRISLLAEELEELTDELEPLNGFTYGVDDLDLPAVAKEMADVLYILYGTAVAWGIDLDEAFRRVHESNMSKLWSDGRPRYRYPDGKVLKPPTYQKPDLTDTVKEL